MSQHRVSYGQWTSGSIPRFHILLILTCTSIGVVVAPFCSNFASSFFLRRFVNSSFAGPPFVALRCRGIKLKPETKSQSRFFFPCFVYRWGRWFRVRFPTLFMQKPHFLFLFFDLLRRPPKFYSGSALFSLSFSFLSFCVSVWFDL